MGRKRQSRLDLPERVYFHHGAYYFVNAANKWIKLDVDYLKAMARWAEIIQLPERAETVGDLLDRYVREVLPNKAERTQKDNLGEIRYLRSFFGAMGIDAVAPSHIASYRDSRTAKTRGNREVALLSHAFSKGCEWGLSQTNPCREVKRNKEVARDRYVTDEELEKFKELCAPWLKTYLGIKALIALRQQDMFALKWSDVTEQHLLVAPIKNRTTTRKKLAIQLTPELSLLLSSLSKRGSFLFMTREEKPYTTSAFGSIWRRLMTKFQSSGHERFREHDIRGKVATDMQDPVAAQQLLGHSSIKMTEAYIKQRSTDVVQPHRRTE
jgi:integrase